jgi:hypothetical protein
LLFRLRGKNCCKAKNVVTNCMSENGLGM